MIYLDNAATTAPSLSAFSMAEQFIKTNYFNPSALYRGGISCLKELNLARESVLKNLGIAANYDVVFTSCGTESDNLAIFGVSKRDVYITDKGEHSAISKCFAELSRRNADVRYAELNQDGSVNVDDLLNLIPKSGTALVSIMHVNNETGAINDICAIADKIKKINPSVIFHSDGVQAYGKIPFIFSDNIDLYSVSAHKINALKGCGALIKKHKINLSPIIFGGGQENGLRSGTENVFGIKVFQFAGEEHYSTIKEDYNKIQEINLFIRNNLDKNIFTVISGENASPYILSVSALGLKGEVIMHSLENEDIIVGNGSACSSKNPFSRVLQACGLNRALLNGVIRISFSGESNLEQAKIFTEKINRIAKKLKGIMG